MLSFSVIHPMPNGDTFHFSSHHSEAGANLKIETLKREFKNHPEKFDSWFNPKHLYIRDNFPNK